MARLAAARLRLLPLLLIASLLVASSALLTPVRPPAVKLCPLIPAREASEIVEPRAQELLARIESVAIKVSASISSEAVETTFARFPAPSARAPRPLFGRKAKKAPIVLLHGFDSSACEYRRLAPLLAEAVDRDVIVPDLLGWGFTRPPSDLASFGPEAKMDHLRSFIRQVCGSQPVVVVGASLGGALAINLAADTPSMVDRVVLIDAQGFIDGKGPSDLPIPLARLGVNVLKSTPLRMLANILAYSDKKLATLDAMRVGKLHCYTDFWERASIDFLRSGGFSPSAKVPLVGQETLVLWGRNDAILEPSTADRFVETLPRCRLQWVEDCGHVPHLEQPALTASYIADFLA